MTNIKSRTYAFFLITQFLRSFITMLGKFLRFLNGKIRSDIFIYIPKSQQVCAANLNFRYERAQHSWVTHVVAPLTRYVDYNLRICTNIYRPPIHFFKPNKLPSKWQLNEFLFAITEDFKLNRFQFLRQLLSEGVEDVLTIVWNFGHLAPGRATKHGKIHYQ